MPRSEVVEVEDPNLEDSEVGTDTEVGNSDDGGQLWRWEKGGRSKVVHVGGGRVGGWGCG